MSSNQPPATPDLIQQAINDTKNPTPIEVKLETGQVYRGNSPQEVLDQVVKAQTEASRYITQQKAQMAELQTQLEALKQQPAQPQPTADNTQKWLTEWAQNPVETTKAEIAKTLGVPADQLPMLAQQMKQVIARSAIDNAANEFQARVREYPNTPEVNLAMREALVQKYGVTNLQAAMSDPDRLEATYHHLVRENRIQPNAIPPSGNVSPNVPLPNVKGNSVPQSQTTDIMFDFMNQPLEKQREILNRLHAQGLR